MTLCPLIGAVCVRREIETRSGAWVQERESATLVAARCFQVNFERSTRDRKSGEKLTDRYVTAVCLKIMPCDKKYQNIGDAVESNAS